MCWRRCGRCGSLACFISAHTRRKSRARGVQGPRLGLAAWPTPPRVPCPPPPACAPCSCAPRASAPRLTSRSRAGSRWGCWRSWLAGSRPAAGWPTAGARRAPAAASAHPTASCRLHPHRCLSLASFPDHANTETKLKQTHQPQDPFCYGAYSFVPPGGKKAFFDWLGYPGVAAGLSSQLALLPARASWGLLLLRLAPVPPPPLRWCMLCWRSIARQAHLAWLATLPAEAGM